MVDAITEVLGEILGVAISEAVISFFDKKKKK